MLILPSAYCTLAYLVFFSRNKVVYELLSNAEKFQYIFLYGIKVSIFSSAIFLPFFADLNNRSKVKYTNKY